MQVGFAPVLQKDLLSLVIYPRSLLARTTPPTHAQAQQVIHITSNMNPLDTGMSLSQLLLLGGSETEVIFAPECVLEGLQVSDTRLLHAVMICRCTPLIAGSPPNALLPYLCPLLNAPALHAALLP